MCLVEEARVDGGDRQVRVQLSIEVLKEPADSNEPGSVFRRDTEGLSEATLQAPLGYPELVGNVGDPCVAGGEAAESTSVTRTFGALRASGSGVSRCATASPLSARVLRLKS